MEEKQIEKDYFKTEEFYKTIIRACMSILNKYYKTLPFNMKDEISNFVISNFLNNISKSEVNKVDNKNLYYYLYNKLKKLIVKEINKSKSNIIFSQTNNDTPESENFDYLLISDDVYNIEAIDLYNKLDNFLKENYKIKERQTILFYITTQNSIQTIEKFKYSSCQFYTLLATFRKNFAEYLFKIGYLNNLEVLDNITSKRKEYSKRHQLRINGKLSYDENLNDLKIYKLLRKRNDLIKVADYLNINYDVLDRIIFHKYNNKIRNTGKLNLFKIQKLRLKYYKNYTLQELASCWGFDYDLYRKAEKR